MLIGLLCWALSALSFGLGWWLRTKVTPPVVASPTLVMPATLPDAVDRQERLLIERREAVLTQHLQGIASRNGQTLTPTQAAAEARDLLSQL